MTASQQAAATETSIRIAAGRGRGTLSAAAADSPMPVTSMKSVTMGSSGHPVTSATR
jgi:hypothetical protein